MGARERYRRGERVCDRMHGAGTILAREGRTHCVVEFDSGRREVVAVRRLSAAGDECLRSAVPAPTPGDPADTESPTAAISSEVAATLHELRTLFLAIDAGTVDRHYVDFGAVAERLKGGISAGESGRESA